MTRAVRAGLVAAAAAAACWAGVGFAAARSRAAAASGGAESTIVGTRSGRVSGVALGGGLVVYKGIPFAAPPVGALRWRPPQKAAAWGGVRAADHFSPPCMQPLPPRRLGPWTRAFLIAGRPSEDCLYLNVWTPRLPGGRSVGHGAPARALPVMVWIYGGGFTSGGAGVPLYDGAALARRGVVVVSFNYRVGPFGFLALPGLAAESPHHSAGNYALLDQIAALRWVRANIAAFGGDARRVTVFGQSAGAMSIGALLHSPPARGLFARAILMSGPGVIPGAGVSRTAPLAAAEAAGLRYAAALGAGTGGGQSALGRLRALPAARLLAAPGRWAPIRDGWVLAANPAPQSPVPVLIGMVADDIGVGYYGTGPRPAPTFAAYQSGLRGLCGAAAARCAALYPAQNGPQGRAALTAARRDRARVSLSLWAERWRAAGGSARTYFFDHILPWPEHPDYGVFHSSELPYVFDDLDLMRRPWGPSDRRLAREMADYWTNFARTGNPNASGLPRWPNWRSGQTMELGDPSGPIPVATPQRRAFWRERLR